MKYVARRKCTVISEDDSERDSHLSGAPLEDFATTPAFVLIAEPGAGKTTAFKNQAEASGATCVTVRDFLTYDDKPEWHGKTLFLDGLDESRIGTIDGRTTLDRIRGKLDRLGRPSFRLSCRWAEWLGANDKDCLKQVSADGTVTVIRLDPLTQQNIKDILAKNHRVEDTDGFIAAAKTRGIDGLLKNPQTLELLAESVSKGEWPNSRKETFEQACHILVCENNAEHLLGNRGSSDIARLIEVASGICAVQMLTGIAGYTLPDRATPDSDYPSLEEIYGEVAGDARRVLGTRLFVGVSEGRFAPVHRQIAEFLAAQQIARLIEEGLPVQRVVALITGFDGELLAAFSNFSSWLAVHSKSSRRRLSELNPSGLVYAGDAQTYSVDEKREIVINLRRESGWNPWCSRSISKTPGIGKIVSPDLEDTFREILSKTDRSQQHQSHVMMLMQMLVDGDTLPGLAPQMQNIIRDPSWLPGVRCAAFDVMIAYNRSDCIDTDILIKFVGDIDSGTLEDSQDELLGILLKALYPRIWSVDEIQKFLRMPKDVSMTGEYTTFWTSHVPSVSTPDQIGQLLDLVATKFEEYRSFMVGEVSRNTRMGVMPLELLDKTLRASWDAISVKRLLPWLKMASELRRIAPESLTGGIRFGLEWDRDKLKELIAHSVESCMRDRDASKCAAYVTDWLFGARPFDYGLWCLEMALGATDMRVAAFYLGELGACAFDGAYSGGLTIQKARARLEGNATLLDLFDGKIRQLEQTASGLGVVRVQEPAADTRDQIAWQQQIETQTQEWRAAQVDPRLLHRIAEVYVGADEDVRGTTPSERFANLVGSRLDLVAVLHEGLEAVVDCADLPDVRRVVRLFDTQETDLRALPLIAGLDSLERSRRLNVEELREDQIRLAVAILYTLPGQYLNPILANGSVQYRPEWFRMALRDNPRLVADVLRRCVQLKHQTAIQPAVELNHLARDDGHREVAKLVSLRLLELFPNKDTEQARLELGWLLSAALNHCERSQVQEVVKKCLARADLVSGQKIFWLTAGYFVMPDLCREDIKTLSGKSDAALRGVWEFVAVGRFPMELAQEFAVDDLVFLIVLIASSIEIHGMTRDGWWAISNLVGELGSNPLPEVSEAVEGLSTEPALKPWLPTITGVRDRHVRRRREHEFRLCDIRQVTKVLANEDPANAGDLAGLLLDVLEDLSKKIRDSSTSDWRQYWNVDSHNKPTSPRPENACRDALLSDLRNRVEHLGIDAQPEGVYADDRRSDIRASFGGFNVPVEIKRSCHRDLWTAIEDQLIRKYTKHPGAKGYGIYLVFWFGDTEECRPTKQSGWRPPNAAALKLKLTETLSEQERHKISVCVIDVSQPAR